MSYKDLLLLSLLALLCATTVLRRVAADDEEEEDAGEDEEGDEEDAEAEEGDEDTETEKHKGHQMCGASGTRWHACRDKHGEVSPCHVTTEKDFKKGGMFSAFSFSKHDEKKHFAHDKHPSCETAGGHRLFCYECPVQTGNKHAKHGYCLKEKTKHGAVVKCEDDCEYRGKKGSLVPLCQGPKKGGFGLFASHQAKPCEPCPKPPKGKKHSDEEDGDEEEEQAEEEEEEEEEQDDEGEEEEQAEE